MMSKDLFAAVLTGDRASTTELLAAGTDPNTRMTALWHSVIEMVSEHPEYAPYLLKREHHDPNPLVIWTWTPLLLACAQNHWEIAGDLLDAGAEADFCDEKSQTPLLFAIRGAQPDLVYRLLAGGADPNTSNEEGDTLLMTAAMMDNRPRSLHTMPLQLAAKMRGPSDPELWPSYTEILKALIAQGADVNAATQDGDTALIFAASLGWTEGVRLLLEAGANLLCEGKLTGTPLMACLPKYPETARFLIERGANIHAVSHLGGSVLSRVIGYRPEEARHITRRTAAPPDEGKPAFRLPSPRDFMAISNAPRPSEDLTPLNLLLDAGADPNERCEHEFSTPLITAAIQGATESIRCLIQRGADIDGRDSKGRTALMMAAWNGHPEAVQALLECGADYTLVSDKGNTALMSASLPGRMEQMLTKLKSMPPPQPDPEMEARLQQIQEMKKKLGEKGDKIPDVEQMRQFPTDFREGLRASLENSAAKQDSNREKVIKILKGAGATV